jgi:hypothetical protein
MGATPHSWGHTAQLTPRVDINEDALPIATTSLLHAATELADDPAAKGEIQFELRQVLEVRRATDLYAALLCAEWASEEDFLVVRELVEYLPNHLQERSTPTSVIADVIGACPGLPQNPDLELLEAQTLQRPT